MATSLGRSGEGRSRSDELVPSVTSLAHRLGALAPFHVQISDFAPILLEPDVLGYEIRDHEDGASRDPDYLDSFLVRIVRFDVVPTESPSQLKDSRMRVAVKGIARHIIQKVLHQMV